MKKDWTNKKLKDVCVFQYGYAFDSSQFCDDSAYPQLIRIRDVVRGYSETYYKGEIPEGYYVYKGDYLIGMDGEFNIAPWNSERALLNQRVCKISSSSKDVDNRFVFYSMQKVLKKIEDETPFVTVKHLSAKRLNAVNLNIPTLDEQQQIVAELDLLSEMIEKQKAQIEELDKLAQSIFYDMFGDPVTNDKGWEVKKLGDLCVTSSGGTPSRTHNEYYEGGNIPWLRSGEVSQGFIYETELFITEQGMKNSSAKLFPIDTVAVAMYGATVGQVGILKAEMTTNQAICGIFPNDHFSPTFLLYFLRGMQPVYLKNAAGGAQPNISQGVIKNTNLPLVPLSLQQEFAAKIEAIEAMKAKVRQSLKESETLFNSRMDYYFN